MVMGLSMIIAPFDVTMKNVIDSLCVLAASIICYVLQQQEKKSEEPREWYLYCHMQFT